jgi:hypothetical protein
MYKAILFFIGNCSRTMPVLKQGYQWYVHDCGFKQALNDLNPEMLIDFVKKPIVRLNY